MQKTVTKNSALLTQVQQSLVVKMLVPSYQKALSTLALSSDIALKRNLEKILHQENPQDLQSLYFVEDTLENLVEQHLKNTASEEQLRQEFSQKAEKLIRTFLFLDKDQVDQLVPPLKTLPLEGLKAIINQLRQGHRKQSEYLNTFVEKDPKIAIKFEVIASGKFEHNNKKTDQK